MLVFKVVISDEMHHCQYDDGDTYFVPANNIQHAIKKVEDRYGKFSQDFVIVSIEYVCELSMLKIKDEELCS